MQEYRGQRLTIRYCEQPGPGDFSDTWTPESLRDALTHIDSRKHDACMAKLVARRQRLADVGQLRSPDHWNTEGKLPDGKRFYAIKADRIRAYGWFSAHERGVFYISHFAFKKGEKLSDADIDRVATNWRHIEKNE